MASDFERRTRPVRQRALHFDDAEAELPPVGSYRTVVPDSNDGYEEQADGYLGFEEPRPSDERDGNGVAAGRWGVDRLNGSSDSIGHEEPEELDYKDYFDEDEDDDDEFVDVTSTVTRNALEWAVVLVGAVLVALLLRASLFQAFYIPSESMETTLSINDRVLVNKLSYRLHDINRGDIVVFARPDDQQGEIRDLIKRVIGLPGETIEARDNVLYINGQRLIEPYLDDNVVTADFGPTVIPDDEVFVMGDNRTESYDSRVFGTVSEDRVVGRAFVLFWPLNRLGSL